MADTTGYKAVVFLYLNGGQDAFDTVIPYDQPSWDKLKGYRGSVLTSSRQPSNLLKLNPTNAQAKLGTREIGLPQELSDFHSMFESGEGAIVGNVGTLAYPIPDGQLEDRSIWPARVGSHNDNASFWQSLEPEGSIKGWGGDMLEASYSSAPSGSDDTFAAITTGSTTPFLFGDMIRQFKAQDTNALRPFITTGANLNGNIGTQARNLIGSYLQLAVDPSQTNLYGRDFDTYREAAIGASEQMFQARQASTPLQTQFPNGQTGDRFRQIAEAIQIRNALNTPRQAFFVNVGGFDTHRLQAQGLHPLQKRVNDAVAAFRSAMIEIGEWDNVVIMTGSDFGRTLVGNGQGTDHGWAGHSFVFGGGVQGRTIYGEISEPDFNDHRMRQDNGRGIVVPEVSIEQFAATIAKWFGLTDSELDTVFPNLVRFAQRDLGFMG